MADLQIHSNLAIAAGATFIPVCSLSVGLRFYARKLKGAGLEADDWLIMCALVSHHFPPCTCNMFYFPIFGRVADEIHET